MPNVGHTLFYFIDSHIWRRNAVEYLLPEVSFTIQDFESLTWIFDLYTMGIYKIPAAALLISAICSSALSHITKRPPSVISHARLSINRGHKPSVTKIQDFQTSDTISPIFLQAPPLTVASSSSDHHFQWWGNSNPPELVQSGWYGFNQFTPRAARNLGKNSNRKARAPLFLGESSQVQPLTAYKPQSNQPKQYDEEFAIQEILRELQRNIQPLPQRARYVEPQVIMIEQALGLPPGIIFPVVRPSHNNIIPQHANYRRPKKDIRRLASAPTPVTIKVVPLKISSIDIANVLKSMSFLPIPLEFLRTEEKDSGGNDEITFDDKISSDDESDLPPPSSHVATPLDKPLGITYADSQQTEHYVSNYQPRK